jgi:hypothetical protein
MHYSFPQNMMDTVRAWPEYQELLQNLRQMGVDVDLIIEHLRAQFGLHPLYKRRLEHGK